MMHPCAPRLFFLLLPLALASSLDDVALVLHKVKPALQGASSSPNNAQLATWNASTPLCLWRGLRWTTPDGRPLRCNLSLAGDLNQDELLLASIRLPAAALAGRLPPELGAFSALESLYLGANSLSGPIPLELGNAPALSVLDLAGNALSGALPTSIWNLCDLRVRELRLHGNALTGAIPAPAGPNTTCDGLRVLDLGANRFSGEFPSFVVDFRGLQRLDLGENNLSGPIPPQLFLQAATLKALNLSYNNLSGQLPPSSSRFGADSFLGNNLCGPPLHRQCGVSMSSRGVAGMVIGLMAGAVVAASLCIGWAHHGSFSSCNRKRREGETTEEAEEEEQGQRQQHQEMVVFEGGEHLTPEDVLNATGQVVAKARYCTVYKAKLGGGGGSIELRLLRDGCCISNNCSSKEEKLVVRRIGRTRHDNLVPLRAFYQGRRGEKLLVYDHYPRTRTLHDLLLLQPPAPAAGGMLTWPRRHKIALGISRALAYLHNASTLLTHGNVSSSTVLVDEDLFVPRLAEYALHRLLPPAAADALLAAAKADGYKAPELRTMSKCSARTDVYAFGILLLELLMGRKSSAPPPLGVNHLPSLVKAAAMEESPLEELLDADLQVKQHHEGLLQALKLAMGCCAPVPAARPTMPEVVRHLEECRPHHQAALYSPTESRSDAGTPTTI